MKPDVRKDEGKFMGTRRHGIRRYRRIICLVVVAIFFTVCALIRPASTLEMNPENREEQIYDEDTKDYPVLEDDGAFLSELNVGEGTVISESEDSRADSVTVKNKDKIAYSLSLKLSSYTDEIYGEGRVKLEFVLPLPEEQAAFELSTMSWMDNSTGYEPEVTVQNRIIDENETSCQVLSGYMLLMAQGENGGVIPGEFTQTVVIDVKNVPSGNHVGMQVNAAMEHNTWEGVCENHQRQEKLTVTTKNLTVVSEIQKEEEEQETSKEIMSDGENPAPVAETAEGSNWKQLRDSGWFEEYSGCTGDGEETLQTYAVRSRAVAMNEAAGDSKSASMPSDVQIENRGGENTSSDGVKVSKTIYGTELENVFDIRLQVQTSNQISEVIREPDMAVVIVMDISNTMKSDFGDATRYEAAMEAAEGFLDRFAENNALGVSKVGYVAFNTDAHQIFGLQECTGQSQANALKNIMRTQTGKIINASDYETSHSRFTNIEAGLKKASDMLKEVTNQNKFIIFLSDGFPTTYIQNQYSGYDPYDSTGDIFYDNVLKKKCLYGTSYSNEAAIRASSEAGTIKKSGVTIFSVGVDVGGQTIQTYITQSEKADGYSVVDRKNTTYVIGGASDSEAYKNWLGSSIGSDYYYDSTDSSGLLEAYENIFEEIKIKVEEGSRADWVTEDPMPSTEGSEKDVEFISFYDSASRLIDEDSTGEYKLNGEHILNGENTAAFDKNDCTIHWDLKKSGYQESVSGNVTLYTYQLNYRVRLKNEADHFAEDTIYPTNDPTRLQYRLVQGTGGELTISDPKTVDFPIPSVCGYLGELQFQKEDSEGKALAGAEFTLKHDTAKCSICRGDGKNSVVIGDMTAVSGKDGRVSFDGIPSGHQYLLTETRVPDGYISDGDIYCVDVAYDEVKVTVKTLAGDTKEWCDKIINRFYTELPDTGGAGMIWYMIGGLLLTGTAGTFLLYKYKKERK